MFANNCMHEYYTAGLKKKLETLAKQKECDIIGEWQKSIINHFYWCVVSSPDGDAEMMKAKWLSLDNHIHNQHDGHGQLFPACEHADDGAKKKWLRRRTFYIIIVNIWFHNCTVYYADSKASNKLTPIVMNPLICKDMTRLSPLYQTSNLEAYHSVVIHFAPKSTAFSYVGMLSRLVSQDNFSSL